MFSLFSMLLFINMCFFCWIVGYIIRENIGFGKNFIIFSYFIYVVWNIKLLMILNMNKYK